MRTSERDGFFVVVFTDDDFSNPDLLEDVFERLIERREVHRLVADLSRVKAVTSLGVAVIVAAHGIALIHKTPLVFAGIQPKVRDILALIGVEETLVICDSVDEAVSALAEG